MFGVRLTAEADEDSIKFMGANSPTPIEPVQRKSLKNGLITDGAVAENEYPMDALLECINFNADTIGRLTLRKGSTLLGNQIVSSDILGLYQFRDSGAGTNNQIIAVNGTVVYYLSGSTWNSKRTGLTAGSRARFSTFLDYVFMVNGTEATAIWDGAPGDAFVTTGNAASAPIGKFIENYRARMWIAGNPTYPDRVYYSSLPSAVTTPIITWDTSVTTGQWIDVSPSDGENITALHRTKAALLVFKNNHLYRIFSILQADPDPQFNVGTYSQESVVETKNGVYFHHPTGFYRYDGNVTEISRPIIDIVRAVTLSNYPKITGYLEPDGDHVCWSVGDVTINGVTFSKLVVRYTISTQTWSHYSYPSQFLASSPYNDGTNLYQLVGDTVGNVFQINTGKTDNGTPISYSIIHPFDSVDGFRSTTKIVTKILFECKNMTGANITYQIPDNNKNDWTKEVGQFANGSTGFSNVSLRGQRLSFRVAGFSTGEPITYEGYEILEGTSQLINFT